MNSDLSGENEGSTEQREGVSPDVSAGLSSIASACARVAQPHFFFVTNPANTIFSSSSKNLFQILSLYGSAAEGRDNARKEGKEREGG